MQLLKRHVKFRHYLHEIERKFKNIMYIFSTELVKYSRVKQYSINQSTDLRHTIGMPSYKNSREAWFRFYMYMTLPTCDTWSNVSSRYIQLRVSPTFFFFFYYAHYPFSYAKKKNMILWMTTPIYLLIMIITCFCCFHLQKKRRYIRWLSLTIL